MEMNKNVYNHVIPRPETFISINKLPFSEKLITVSRLKKSFKYA